MKAKRKSMAVECSECGHKWKPDPERLAQIVRAAIVNRDGPHCNMCQALIMAARYADLRGVYNAELLHIIRRERKRLMLKKRGFLQKLTKITKGKVTR
jgi:hypothetical protein